MWGQTWAQLRGTTWWRRGRAPSPLVVVAFLVSVFLAMATYGILRAQNQALAKQHFSNAADRSVILLREKLEQYALVLRGLRDMAASGRPPTQGMLRAFYESMRHGYDPVEFTLLAMTRVVSRGTNALSWRLRFAYPHSIASASVLRDLRRPRWALLQVAGHRHKIYLSSQYTVRTSAGKREFMMMSLPVPGAGPRHFISIVFRVRHLVAASFPLQLRSRMRMTLADFRYVNHTFGEPGAIAPVYDSAWLTKKHRPLTSATIRSLANRQNGGFFRKETFTFGGRVLMALFSTPSPGAFVNLRDEVIMVAGTLLSTLPGMLLAIVVLYMGGTRREVENRVRERTQALAGAKRHLEVEIARRHRLQRELIEISEAERRRFGRELHDDLGQKLAAARFMLERLGTALRGESRAREVADQHIAQIGTCMSELASQARHLARGLNPIGLENRGIFAALEQLCEKVQQCTGVDCIFECAEQFDVTNRELATHLYRIAQEAVNNATKHAAGSLIKVRLGLVGSTISLAVADDGSGIASRTSGSMGMQIMRYRSDMVGARMRIFSKAGQGTIVAVRATLGRDI